jgi:ATP-dependent Zn protease
MAPVNINSTPTSNAITTTTTTTNTDTASSNTRAGGVDGGRKSNSSLNPQPQNPLSAFLSFVKRVVILTVIMMQMSLKRGVTGVQRLLRFGRGMPADAHKNEMPPVLKKLYGITSKMSKVMTTRMFWARLFGAGITGSLLAKYLSYTKSLTTEISYADFLKLLKSHPDKIDALKVSATSFSFMLEGRQMVSRMVNLNPDLLDRLVLSGVNFTAAATPVNVLGLLWTCCYAYFLWNLSSRMMQGPQDGGAGKRKDKSMAGLNGLSFSDIAGQERAKLEVQEVCQMLQYPQAYTQIGARLPAGVLLVGPPGTGKTLLARVAAAEAGVPFYSCSATDFVEVFVGRGPSRVRKLFEDAATNAPCIVFIDEIDSLGRSRRMGSLNSEQENTLNQLLTSMDGLDTSNNGVIVMAATNRYELLDPALLRAGRFDRIINCPLPDKSGREAILRVHTRKLKVRPDVDLEKIARLTAGCCGADLAAIVNEAAIRTARRQGSEINNADFEDALRSFLSARGIPLSGIAEAASSVLPSWLGGRRDGSDEGAAAPST